MLNPEEKELQNLIREIVRRVLAQLQQAEHPESIGTLLLAPAWIPYPGAIEKYCRDHCPGKVAGLGSAAGCLTKEITLLNAETRQEQTDALEILGNAQKIVLINPTLTMLQSIVRGGDEGFFEQLFLRALLWGKQAAVLLDFEKPKFQRGTFFQELGDALGAIEQMGAEVVSIPQPNKASAGLMSLVTERDVIDAYRAHGEKICCSAGAIVTQLARDTAKELGIFIQE